eukprot:2889690-Alexandrium_andersonii.AAC.1
MDDAFKGHMTAALTCYKLERFRSPGAAANINALHAGLGCPLPCWEAPNILDHVAQHGLPAPTHFLSDEE